jgi:hypothetical protein
MYNLDLITEGIKMRVTFRGIEYNLSFRTAALTVLLAGRSVIVGIRHVSAATFQFFKNKVYTPPEKPPVGPISATTQVPASATTAKVPSPLALSPQAPSTAVLSLTEGGVPLVVPATDTAMIHLSVPLSTMMEGELVGLIAGFQKNPKDPLKLEQALRKFLTKPTLSQEKLEYFFSAYQSLLDGHLNAVDLTKATRYNETVLILNSVSREPVEGVLIPQRDDGLCLFHTLRAGAEVHQINLGEGIETTEQLRDRLMAFIDAEVGSHVEDVGTLIEAQTLREDLLRRELPEAELATLLPHDQDPTKPWLSKLKQEASQAIETHNHQIENELADRDSTIAFLTAEDPNHHREAIAQKEREKTELLSRRLPPGDVAAYTAYMRQGRMWGSPLEMCAYSILYRVPVEALQITEHPQTRQRIILDGGLVYNPTGSQARPIKAAFFMAHYELVVTT